MLTKLPAAIGLAFTLMLSVAGSAEARGWGGGRFHHGPVYGRSLHRGPVYGGPVYVAPPLYGPEYGGGWRRDAWRREQWRREHGRFGHRY